MEASVTTPPTLAERIASGVQATYVEHGYVDEDGEITKRVIEDKVFELVLGAVVEKRGDRGKIAITRRNLVATVFPRLPGPDEFDDQDEPALAGSIYSRIDTAVWKLVNVNHSDPIQSRLNSETGLVLCRTLSTPDKVWAVYSTRDLNCILTDFAQPQKDKIVKDAERLATNLAMTVERVPEHSKRFLRELNDGIKIALAKSTAILGPVVEATEAEKAEAAHDGDDDE
jgi:hypothetical protein